MCGSDSPPPPSKTPDSTVAKDKTKKTCPPDDKLKLVELVEVFKQNGKWKQSAVNSRKQFINLDDKVDAKKDHPEFGRAVWLKARLEWTSGDKSCSLKGKNVYFYANGDKANHKKLAAAAKASFDSAGGGKDKKTATADKGGWTKPVPFYLSMYGGDKFDVYATLDKKHKGGLKAGAYTVWRKLWFQVSEMKDRAGKARYTLPAAVTKAVSKGYKKAKIEFTEKGPRGKIPHKGNTPTAAMGKVGKTHFVSDDRVPFKCHLMTCDYGGQTSEKKNVKDKLKAKTWTSPNWYVLWPHGGSLSWKVSAKYRKGKAWKNIPAANLSVQTHGTQPGFKKVKIDFTGGPVTPTAKAPVRIKLRLKCTGPSFYLGWGGGDTHILLCTGLLRDCFPKADHNLIQRSDTVHEIGHALGLVNMPPTKAGAHNAWLDKKNANHCKQPANKCAMFWESSTTRLTTFHSIGGAGCNEHLRTQDFARGTMKPLWT